MKNEMIKFVSENFEVIKNNFCCALLTDGILFLRIHFRIQISKFT